MIEVGFAPLTAIVPPFFRSSDPTIMQDLAGQVKGYRLTTLWLTKSAQRYEKYHYRSRCLQTHAGLRAARCRQTKDARRKPPQDHQRQGRS